MDPLLLSGASSPILTSLFTAESAHGQVQGGALLDDHSSLDGLLASMQLDGRSGVMGAAKLNSHLNMLGPSASVEYSDPRSRLAMRNTFSAPPPSLFPANRCGNFFSASSQCSFRPAPQNEMRVASSRATLSVLFPTFLCCSLQEVDVTFR